MPIQSSTHFLGILGVLAASLLWGTTGTAAAFAPEVSAAAIAAAAMGGGGLLQALRGLPLIRRNRALLKRHSALRSFSQPDSLSLSTRSRFMAQ